MSSRTAPFIIAFIVATFAACAETVTDSWSVDIDASEILEGPDGPCTEVSVHVANTTGFPPVGSQVRLVVEPDAWVVGSDSYNEGRTGVNIMGEARFEVVCTTDEPIRLRAYYDGVRNEQDVYVNCAQR